MARTVQDAKLKSRAARRDLAQRHRPYWREIDSGRRVGYRKGGRGGVWIARFYVGAGQYREQRLGIADDVLDADGVAVLNFTQAQEQARKWFEVQARIAAGLEPVANGPFTVADALAAYLDHYVARGGKARRQTTIKINALIKPVLGAVPVATLTTKRIRDWLHALAASPPRVRTAIGEAQAYGKSDERKRRATANRTFTILRAALNYAWREDRIASDAAWRKVQPFADADVPVVSYLSEAECVRLVNATDEEFRPLVRGALLSGCRLGELLALRASDFNADSGVLAIRASKGGKARHIVLTDEGRLFFTAATAGKLASALIFVRADGTPWQPGAQQRPMRTACERAKISPAVSFHVLRHTYGSLAAQRGIPMPVIGAQLGHAPGSPMTARHYAHLGPSYVAEQIRAHFPVLGIAGQSNVTPLRAQLKPGPEAPAASGPKRETMREKS